MRFLFWLGLVALIVLAVRKKLQAPGKTETPGRDQIQKGSAVETMVCCAHCQVYLPASEAVHRGQKVYCCNEHADLA